MTGQMKKLTGKCPVTDCYEPCKRSQFSLERMGNVCLFVCLFVFAVHNLKFLFLKFLVRYLDYGNCEKRKKECVISLHSKFRMIPFQALCCSIACPGHVAFTEKVRLIYCI